MKRLIKTSLREKLGIEETHFDYDDVDIINLPKHWSKFSKELEATRCKRRRLANLESVSLDKLCSEDKERKIVAHLLRAHFRDGKLEVTEQIIGFGFENPGSDIVDLRIYSHQGGRSVMRRIDPAKLKKAEP